MHSGNDAFVCRATSAYWGEGGAVLSTPPTMLLSVGQLLRVHPVTALVSVGDMGLGERACPYRQQRYCRLGDEEPCPHCQQHWCLQAVVRYGFFQRTSEAPLSVGVKVGEGGLDLSALHARRSSLSSNARQDPRHFRRSLLGFLSSSFYLPHTFSSSSFFPLSLPFFLFLAFFFLLLPFQTIVLSLIHSHVQIAKLSGPDLFSFFLISGARSLQPELSRVAARPVP